MKINNKKITGIFKYTLGLEFTKNDLVISDLGKLYVCKQDILITDNDLLENTDYFQPYLAGETATLQDYIAEANSGTFSKKLLTTDSLYSILNYYNVGLDGNGIIGGYINNTSVSYATSSIYGDQLLDNKSCLFRLMIDPHVNNGVFKIHRSLPELEGFINQPTTGNDSYVILRQYTYKEGQITYRIQEVIDHVTPTIIYRYCRLSDTTVAPTFQLAFIGEDQYIKKLQSAINLTRARIKELDDTKAALINNFRFSNINFTGDKIKLQGISPTSDEGTYIENLRGGLLITLLIVTKNSPKKSFSVTVTTNPENYYVDDSATVIVSAENNNKITIELDNNSKNYYMIQSAYYQQYYQ